MFPVTLLFIGLTLVGITYSLWHARVFARRFPNVGELIDIGGYRLNSVHLPASGKADLPPVVFIHGASGNLLDQLHAFAPALDNRAEMLFVDRPGHGYSERGGAENDLPDGQAAAIARLMDKRGIGRAVIVGHSFGGAIAASFALHHPERTAGLILLAPATHPWPGGIDWYYRFTALPVIGWLFAHTLVTPLGQRRIEGGTRSIFSPNPRPGDYIDKTGPHLVLRPATFRNNARDIANLHAYLTATAPRYREITAQTVIITGDSDGIVLADIHSRGLARDIPGAELLWIGNLGHKPDYVVTDVVVAALEKMAGQPTDLEQIKRRAEARLIPSSEAISQN
ncbi:alpha/beta hydrolase [Ensifer adhaerens]|uniref:alpha/beta fold hydrolase n=1 Tax=Ensifer adhaerens TaxID=106592 RepID=UPI001CC04F8E|nr:alpha/beta hydrolase [Ensifer adhaerens]MBZ7923234.1 alpha/beta hydrolase [Ensifer adhaerens]UAX94737.1 alpha/beta hydrolase [Ensifer adhaerens]UAY02375.1 alpha/beta hydrolase [Ensifer adhaerens]UAY09755.1 alpha/beta hydrolase [Ensifer adhaerens]